MDPVCAAPNDFPLFNCQSCKFTNDVSDMMYEGKNIHFSPLDNKPLCSFSGKLCKQRRLNGYALCLRHVLEDPAAPFRRCNFMARNRQQCTNPIHERNTSP